MMLKCNEITRLAATEEIARAGLLRRLEFHLHLLMCRHCREYVRQVRWIGATARRLLGTSANDVVTVARLETDILTSLHTRPKPASGNGVTPPPAR